jgi:protocatechuate 3,4-dioxygenase beta subunit
VLVQPRAIGLLLASAAASAQTSVAVGEHVPDLAFSDLAGARTTLAAMRQDIVVLEWTSYLCPAVAALHDARLVADTRAALKAQGVRWLMVDSSWYAAAGENAIADWRQRLGLESVPYFLDGDAAAAEVLGATVTPQACVIDQQGRLAYRGAITSGGDEATRKNHVLEAVNALVAGKVPPVGEVRPHGCGIHRDAPPGLAPAAFDEAAVDEDAAANDLYRKARAAAAKGERQTALAMLERSVTAGHPWPFRAMTDAAFSAAWADGDSRRRLRELLADHAPVGRMTLVSPDEPGEPLVVAGTIRDTDGQPIAGASFRVYHTDAAGWYSQDSTQGDNPRLAGGVRTDRAGRYRIRTIFPGHYATSPDGPAHIHVRVDADGYHSKTGHPASIFFADDPALRGAARTEIEGDGCAICAPIRNAEGVRTYVHDVVLRRR